jgi:hypothetical protein
MSGLRHPRYSKPKGTGQRRGESPATVLAQSEVERHSFDVDFWMTLIAEQRRLIASAAGVDPSKVKIRVGH